MPTPAGPEDTGLPGSELHSGQVCVCVGGGLHSTVPSRFLLLHRQSEIPSPGFCPLCPLISFYVGVSPLSPNSDAEVLAPSTGNVTFFGDSNWWPLRRGRFLDTDPAEAGQWEEAGEGDGHHQAEPARMEPFLRALRKKRPPPNHGAVLPAPSRGKTRFKPLLERCDGHPGNASSLCLHRPFS